MPRMLLGLLFDVVAGVLVAGVLAALVAVALPTRPAGQAWLWLVALVSIVAVGAARRRLASGSRGRGRFDWLRRIISRTSHER